MKSMPSKKKEPVTAGLANLKPGDRLDWMAGFFQLGA